MGRSPDEGWVNGISGLVACRALEKEKGPPRSQKRLQAHQCSWLGSHGPHGEKVMPLMEIRACEQFFESRRRHLGGSHFKSPNRLGKKDGLPDLGFNHEEAESRVR